MQHSVPGWQKLHPGTASPIGWQKQKQWVNCPLTARHIPNEPSQIKSQNLTSLNRPYRPQDLLQNLLLSTTAILSEKPEQLHFETSVHVSLSFLHSNQFQYIKMYWIMNKCVKSLSVSLLTNLGAGVVAWWIKPQPATAASHLGYGLCPHSCLPSSLLMHRGKQQRPAQRHGHLHPNGRPGWSSWLQPGQSRVFGESISRQEDICLSNK